MALSSTPLRCLQSFPSFCARSALVTGDWWPTDQETSYRVAASMGRSVPHI